jgi:hypothetical protein
MSSLRALLLTAVPLAAACGGSVTSDPPDAAVDAVTIDASTLPDAEVPTPPDAGIDAEGSRPRCDVDEPFGPPVKLLGPVDSDTGDLSPWLSRDERRMYFGSNRRAGGTQLFLATRDDADANFGDPQHIDVPGTGSVATNPTLSEDEKTLWVESRGDIYRSIRAAIGDPFPEATRIAVNSSVDTVQDLQPVLAHSGDALYFSSTRAPVAAGQFGLFRATRSGSDFTIAANAAPIITGAQHAFLSDDERTIYYMVNGSRGKIVTATRALVSDPFGAPTDLPQLESADANDEDAPGWVSPDGCRMYMHSNRSGQRDIYVATRPPLP